MQRTTKRTDAGHERHKLYDSRWTKQRNYYLKTHPTCVMCDKAGKVVPATIVDHITPHRGDLGLFWDMDNWQSLCKLHHDSTKQRMEKTGVMIGGYKDGTPIDPNHHWNV